MKIIKLMDKYPMYLQNGFFFYKVTGKNEFLCVINSEQFNQFSVAAYHKKATDDILKRSAIITEELFNDAFAVAQYKITKIFADQIFAE